MSTVEEIESAIEKLPPEQVREVGVGFDQLEKGRTVTVESKEVFAALLREPVKHSFPTCSVAAQPPLMPEACQHVAGASRE